MTSTISLLDRALTSDSSRPLLTFYDDATGERVELSATTMNNWACKTANLITLDCGLAPGAHVSVSLPRHWLFAVWLLACDITGMRISDATSTGGDHAELAVVGPDAPFDVPSIAADEVFACSLAPLGMPFTEPLPPGVRDYSADVRLMPDAAGPFSTPGELGDRATQRATELGLHTGDRLMAMSPEMSVSQGVDEWLAPLAAGASVVWVRNPDLAACVTRWGAEQVTHAFGPLPAGAAVPDTIRTL